MSRTGLPKGVLARVVLRSFFLQSSWNFERMQNLGFLFAVAPALRVIHEGEALAAAFRRHMEYFNTHPFMASPVIGTVIALEEKEHRGHSDYLGTVEFKRMVMAPYAAMGDAFFWGGVRPAAAGIALFLAVRGSLWAPAVFLLLFNLPHLWFRTRGMLLGYSMGLKVVELFQRRRLPDLAIRLKEGTVVLLGGLCAYLTFLCLRSGDLGTELGLAALPAVILGAKLARKGFSTLVLVVSVAIIVLMVFALF